MLDTTQQFIKDSIQTYDPKSYREQYRQHQLLVIKDFLPPEFVIQYFVPEVENCVKYIHRVNIPGFKKSGSVSYQNIKKHANNLYALYKLREMKKFIESIVEVKLIESPDEDQHAAALYYYTETGDRINKHYDKSFYKGGRYTVLLGIVQDSIQSNLICYPGATKRLPKDNPLVVTTHPGTLVLFNGDILWHEVSPLGENERRIILTMEYITNSRISFLNRLIMNFKDRLLYFGKNQYQT